ncbi:MAG TPA: sulfatase [Candidatus Dormibacteraeota bacterium]|nr:sulfatase [Candidatus Dormibacteraeota bacterium]
MKLRTTIALAVAALLGALALRSLWSARSGPPNVLLITIDTLRADHLHCYGQALPTSPNIDAFAARSVVFERAIAASGYTGPSHSSIMTGRYPRRHSSGFSNGLLVLSGVETLAETLRLRGYDTAAFVSNAVLGARSGLNRGFDVYDDQFDSVEANRSNVYERRAPQTLERALAWLARPRTKPFFLWVHFQDPHGPYTAPAPYGDQFHLPVSAGEPELPVLDDDSGQGGIPRYQVVDGQRRVSEYRSRYAGEIAFMDRSVGELLAAVERYSPTVVALTGDHGESFGEGGFYFAHGHSAAPDLSHVPFILRAPGLRPERRADSVSHVDLMPTILELAAVPAPAGMEGIALGPVLRADAPIPPRAVFCDIGYEVGTYGADEFQLSATPEEKTWTLQAFYQRGEAAQAGAVAGAERLTVAHTYRWDGGPTWTAADPEPELAQRLASYLAGDTLVGQALPLSSADRERLRSLGYQAP